MRLPDRRITADNYILYWVAMFDKAVLNYGTGTNAQAHTCT